MRRISTLMLTGVLALSLCACNDTTNTPVDTDVNTVSPDTTITKPINPDVGGVTNSEPDNLFESSTEDGFGGTSGTFGDADGDTSAGESTDSGGFGGGLAIVNPWTDCNTIEEAEEIVGFTFDSIKSAEINTISAMISEGMNIIQASFYDGENEITIRKSNAIGDISGDYRTFENVIKETRDDTEIIYSGNGETFGLVTWVKDNFSYSISCETEISKDILDSFVNVVFEDNTEVNQAVLYGVGASSSKDNDGKEIIAEYSIPVMVRVVGPED